MSEAYPGILHYLWWRGFQKSLTIVTKCSILDVCRTPGYASQYYEAII